MNNLLAWLMTTVAFWKGSTRLTKHERVPKLENLLLPPTRAPPPDDRFGYGLDLGAEPPPAREIMVAPPKPPKSVGGEGEFYFKDNVLDQLEYYVEAVKRLKKFDYDSYAMISRLGANLIPDRMALSVYKMMPGPTREKYKTENRLEPWFLQALPSFGAVCYTTDKWNLDEEKKTNKTSPRIFYFNKYSLKGRPVVIQPVSPDAKAIYIVGSVWDYLTSDTKERETGISEVALVIEADNSIRALKTLNTHYVEFPVKNKKRSHRGFYRRDWEWPEGFVKFAKHNDMTPEGIAINMFVGAAAQHELFNASMIRVAVEKDGVVAQMNVNVERTPYFFRDREVVVNENGVTKRIFHIVRPHVRESGAKVRMHFRGLRKFGWNGYGITITVPGLDHGFVAELPFDSLATDSELSKELEMGHERVMSQPVMARKIAAYLQPRAHP